MTIVNLAGGLMQGFAQGKSQAQDRRMKEEMQKAQIDLAKQHAKLYEQQVKVSGLKEQMQTNILAMLQGEGGIGLAGGAPAAEQNPYANVYEKATTPEFQANLGNIPYADIITKAAGQHGVNPAFLASILKNESGFNPNAVSPKGAQGIAQFMPGTAQAMGVANPLDPAQAIPGAAKYLGQHLKEFGSEPLAAAAYNAGERAVRKYGGIPPYPETQKFVQNVQNSLPEFLAQEQIRQQVESPKKRSSGIDIKSMPMQKRLMLDIAMKQGFDLDTKFRENKTTVKGDVEKGFQVFDDEGNLVKQLPGMGKTEMQAVKVKNPDGSETTMYVPIQTPPPGGGGQGLTMGGVPAFQTEPPGMKPEQAGKMNLAGNASTRLKEIESMVFPKGKLDRGILAKAAMPLGGIGKGSQLYSKMYQAIDAALRLETGAQATPHEITTKMHEYWPSVKDTEETIRVKMKDFNEYVNGVVGLADPTGQIMKMRGVKPSGKKEGQADPLGLR